MALEPVLQGAAWLATVFAALQCFVLRHAIADAGRALSLREARIGELRRLEQAQRDLAAAQNLAESVVAGGTELVRTVHKGIAHIPFSILEAIPATRDITRVVRRAHDLISDAAYGGVGAVNRGVGKLLRRGLALPPQASGGNTDPDEPSGDSKA